MIFEPQVPDWGEKLTFNKLNELIKYHTWLCTTGIKTGLISPKNEQFIWDEFIIHSLYFAKIITEMPNIVEEVSDLGTGGGIPGVPIGITTDIKVNLVDIKEKRVFELSRLLKILDQKNMFSLQEDAEEAQVYDEGPTAGRHAQRGGGLWTTFFRSVGTMLGGIPELLLDACYPPPGLMLRYRKQVNKYIGKFGK